MSEVKNITIKKTFENEVNEKDDILIIEYPFTIFVNDEEFITLLCTPKGLNYLLIGFLASEGLIKSMEDVKEIRIDEEKGFGYVTIKEASTLVEKLYGKRTVTTGCGKGTIFYNVLDSLATKKIKGDITITPQEIYSLVGSFNQMSNLFKETGGVHSCCLCEGDKIILFHEDVGRHNALDKIIGEAMLKGIALEDKLLITSGRISSEMIIKTSKGKIPIIISRSAPTDLSYGIAKELGVTLIGFARGKKMNIYNDVNRVSL